MIYAFLADGFEEIEALSVIDVCRRAGIEVNMVSIMPTETVCSAHGVKIVADSMFADNDYSSAELLFLPGGMPGAQNLNDYTPLCEVIKAHYATGKPLSAICAAPMVYGNLQLLNGKNATCYPGFEKFLTGANYTANVTEKDGQFLTGNGPAAALQLGYDIVTLLKGAETAEALKSGMMYNKLMKK